MPAGSERWRLWTRAAMFGPTGAVFHDSLLDDNAASHIALGSGFTHRAQG
jgi:hypothetical protein